MSKFAAALGAAGVILLFVVGLLFGLVLPKLVKTASAPTIANTAAILQQVQTLSQLVSVKYVLEKLVVLEDAKWYGENRVTLVAHGVVKAGINLALLKPGDIVAEGSKITIALPPPGITDVYLDDHRTQVLERNTGLLRFFDKDLEQNARRQAVDELRTAALHNEILREASERARDQITSLFHQLGYTEVVFLHTRPGK